jgi:hypothetical protein
MPGQSAAQLPWWRSYRCSLRLWYRGSSAVLNSTGEGSTRPVRVVERRAGDAAHAAASRSEQLQDGDDWIRESIRRKQRLFEGPLPLAPTEQQEGQD